MYLNVTYEQEFDDLMMHLRSKYPQKLFDLDGIGEQTDMSKFSKKFFSVRTTADASIDANANVDDISVIAYNSELPKPFFRLNSYYILWEQLKKDWDLQTANEIIEMQLIGDIYIHDFHGVGAGLPYCFNYSTYDIALMGLPMVKKIKSKPPKHLYAFKSQLEQFVVQAANSTLGATGLADMLIIMSYYVDKILKTGEDAHFTFSSEEDIWQYVKETLVSFIYTINQPMRASQCVTEDTEVLTPKGWKNKDELKVGDDIYTWKEGKMNIQSVQKVNVYNYKGEMHRYKGRDYIQEVSPNHRVLRRKFHSDEYTLNYSEDIIDFDSPIPMPVAFRENNLKGLNLTDDEVKLLAFILTEGSINQTKNNKISICKSPNRWGNEELISILNNLDIEYTLRNQNSNIDKKYTINIYDLRLKDTEKYIDILNGTKENIPDKLLEMNQEQAKIFLETWAKLDGHYDRLRLQCDNKIIRDKLQHIAVLAGYGSRKNERNFTSIDNKNEVKGLYLHLYKRKNKEANIKEKFQYKGKIWCPSTKDGIVVYRKNGKVFVSGNSPFTNISLYDDYFLDEMIGDYKFKDGETPNKDTVKNIQKLFIDTMNEELKRTPITFPITTACFSVNDKGKIKDKEFLQFISERNKKYGFINIYIGKTSTLSSCCRLRSDTDSEYFNSFGSGSSKIGSLGVCTVNLPRIAMDSESKEEFLDKFGEKIKIAAKINNAKRKIVKKRINNGNHPLYTNGFMNLKRQYSTLGINGLNEAVNCMRYDILGQDGQDFVLEIMELIKDVNSFYQKKFDCPHNVEQVPAENASIKLVQKDKLMGYSPDVEIYSNQFIPLTTKANLLDRMYLQGKFDKHFSGGAIAHLNIEQQIQDTQKVKDLIKTAAKQGVVYFAINYNLQKCKNDHMSVGNKTNCPICGKKITDNFTRVVGFLTNTKNWHKTRRQKDYPEREWYSKK